MYYNQKKIEQTPAIACLYPVSLTAVNMHVQLVTH